MKEELIKYETALLAKEKGFDLECYTYYSTLQYPLDDSGLRFDKCLCIIEELNTRYDEVRMIWIENELASDMWNEGTYYDGEHSRCDIISPEIKCPTKSTLQKWLREKHDIYVYPKETFIYQNEFKELRYCYTIMNLKSFESYLKPKDAPFKYYKTYEEALEQGLIIALNLI